MSPTLRRRVAFAAVAIPTLIAVVYVGHWALTAVLALAGVLGAREVFDLARHREVEGLRWWAYAAAVAVPVGVQWTLDGLAAGRFATQQLPPLFWAGFGAAAWLIGVLIAAMRRGPEQRPLATLGITTFAVAYAAGLPSFLLVLRAVGAGTAGSAAAGTALAMLPLVLTWVCDTLAMAAGSAIGGPKLAPVLSPNKTWAGAVAGGLGAVLGGPLLGAFVLTPLGVTLPMLALLAIGLGVGIFGQVGDIAESLLKREVGVKDASSLIPGHGGVLDRLDSLYFTVPISAAVATIALGV